MHRGGWARTLSWLPAGSAGSQAVRLTALPPRAKNHIFFCRKTQRFHLGLGRVPSPGLNPSKGAPIPLWEQESPFPGLSLCSNGV